MRRLGLLWWFGVLGALVLAATVLPRMPQPLSAVAAPRQASPPAHLVVIFMENRERSAIIGNSDAPYENAFANAGRNFSHLYAVAHPSLPNYLAVASGSTQGKTGTDSISAGEISGPNIWGQLSTHHVGWRVFEESMPSACFSDSSGDGGLYRLKHNFATPFSSVFNRPKRCARVVPYSALDLSHLPAVAALAPNMCHDMHDCSIAVGDSWLADNVPPLLNAGATVLITFDEGDTNTNGGGNIYAALRGPGISASVNTTTYSTYSITAAIENAYGMRELGSAANAAPLPIG